MDRNTRNRYPTSVEDIPALYGPILESHDSFNRERYFSLPHFHESPGGFFFPDAFQGFPPWPLISSIERSDRASMNRKRSIVGRYETGYQKSSESGHKRRRGESTVISVRKEPTPKDLKYGKLSKEIKECSVSSEQSQDLLEKKLKLRSALLSIFRKNFPEANLFLVGSSCNGFASNSSDADFCLLLTQSRIIDQKYEAVLYLRSLQRLLKSCDFIKKLQIIRAKVPILKFNDTISGCECDVNINNSVGIRNTHLLRTYSRIDSRLRPMLIVVKKWAKLKDINDASQGTLSSYSLALMVIHFLQCGCKPPVLPSLQRKYPEYFSEELDLNRLPMFEPADHIPCNASENQKSMGELLLGFFEYFGIHFRWDFLAVSVRLGRALPKALKNEWRYTFICIEEPFNQTNTARAVHQPKEFDQIKEEFRLAYEKLQEDPSIDSLLS